MIKKPITIHLSTGLEARPVAQLVHPIAKRTAYKPRPGRRRADLSRYAKSCRISTRIKFLWEEMQPFWLHRDRR